MQDESLIIVYALWFDFDDVISTYLKPTLQWITVFEALLRRARVLAIRTSSHEKRGRGARPLIFTPQTWPEGFSREFCTADPPEILPHVQ